MTKTTPNEVAGLIEAARIAETFIIDPPENERDSARNATATLIAAAIRGASLSPTEAPEPLVEREPVAWLYENESGDRTFEFNPNGDSAWWLIENGYTETPLYAALSSSISNAEPVCDLCQGSGKNTGNQLWPDYPPACRACNGSGLATEDSGEVVQADGPDRIWLEPSCQPERCWHDMGLEDCEEPGCEAKAVEYVRADLAFRDHRLSALSQSPDSGMVEAALRKAFCDGVAWEKYGCSVFEKAVKESVTNALASLSKPPSAGERA